MATGPVQGNWRCEMYAAITSQNNTSVTISCTAAIQTVNGYHYVGLTVRGSAGVNGQWANVDRSGVSVNPGQNVNMATKTLTIAKTKSVQSIACGGEIRVTGFAAGVSGATMTVSVPALASHKVTYNANGGTGAPAAQTKWYGEALTLSSAKPTRPNYVFQGWATSSGGAVVYQPGGRYGSDANLTLYAVWKLATKPPTIQSFTAQRVDAAGVPDSNGTMVRFTAQWRVDTTGDSANACKSLRFGYKNANGSWTDYDPVVNDGTSGTTTIDAGPFSTGSSYQLRVTLSDKYTTVSSVTTVGPARFVIDVSPDGRGIGIGVEAPDDGVSIYGKPIRMDDGEAGIEITSTDGSSIYVGARGININNPRYGHMRLDDNGLNIHNDQGCGLSISAGGWSLTWAGNHTLATGPKAGALYIDGKEIKTV